MAVAVAARSKMALCPILVMPMKACGAWAAKMASRPLSRRRRCRFKADRAGQAAGQLAVALAFGGAGPDGAPADQVTDELRAEQV